MRLGETDEVFVRSAELLADCTVIEDLAFIDTGRKLAGLLKHFDLAPKSNGAERGYNVSRQWVEEWRSHTEARHEGTICLYPPVESSKRQERLTGTRFQRFQSVSLDG